MKWATGGREDCAGRIGNPPFIQTEAESISVFTCGYYVAASQTLNRRPDVALVSLEPSELKRLIRQRRRCGGDRYDEVWDGVYVMAPLADNEHQSLGLKLAIALSDALALDRGESRSSTAAT